jgi:hypothetical protein
MQGERITIELGMNSSGRIRMKRMTVFQMVMAMFLCLILAVPPGLMAQGTQEAPPEQEGPLFRPEEIDQLMAPIALYPDSLLAQILAASTYPLEIVQAARFVEQNKSLKGEKLMQAAKDKDWDPSVKAMLEFPDVLLMMNEKLEWTEKLGDAFLSQQKDVMDSAQRLRQKAQESGNLKTTQEQKVVVEQETKTIIIEPANPQVVYVPTYSPTVVYGAWPYPAYPPYPVYPYGYVAGAAFTFAAGVAIGAAWGGYGGWGCGWGGGEVDVDVNRQNNFTKNNYNNSQKYQKKEGGGGGKNQNWQHNPEHRKGAQYKDQRTAQKFGQQGSGSRARASTSDARGYGQGAGDRGGGRPQTSDLSRGGQGAGDRGGGKPQTGDLTRGGDRQGAGDRGGGKPQTSDLSRGGQGAGDRGGGGRENAMSGAGKGGSERASSYRGQESRSSASRSSGGSRSSGASRSGGGGGGSRGGGGGGGGRGGGGGGGGGRR